MRTMTKAFYYLTYACTIPFILCSICFSFLVLSFKELVAIFVAAFIILLIIDHRLFQMHLISDHYFQTRCFVSVIVIISLIISGALS